MISYGIIYDFENVINDINNIMTYMTKSYDFEVNELRSIHIAVMSFKYSVCLSNIPMGFPLEDGKETFCNAGDSDLIHGLGRSRLHTHTHMYIYILLIHSSASGYLGCFHVLAIINIVNSIAMNTQCICIFSN